MQAPPRSASGLARAAGSSACALAPSSGASWVCSRCLCEISTTSVLRRRRAALPSLRPARTFSAGLRRPSLHGMRTGHSCSCSSQRAAARRCRCSQPLRRALARRRWRWRGRRRLSPAGSETGWCCSPLHTSRTDLTSGRAPPSETSLGSRMGSGGRRATSGGCTRGIAGAFLEQRLPALAAAEARREEGRAAARAVRRPPTPLAAASQRERAAATVAAERAAAAGLDVRS
mmetsp:Transcript_37272/g.123479  ORF Transcript_37272/g.123479 Transcript_37272/m.123479 type:complete len:231 (-) Transcript_37272:297-989(-)